MDEKTETPEQRLNTHWKLIEQLQGDVKNLKDALKQLQQEMRDMKNGA